MNIFGVRVDNLSQQEIQDGVLKMLGESTFHQIATVNPEFLLLAREHQDFRDALNVCDLNVADGVGLHIAFWKAGERLKGRYPGADLMEYVCSVAEKKRLRVFLVARQDGLSSWKATATALKEKFPNLKVSGAFAHAQSSDFVKIYEQARGYDVVFCNFGASYQEMFLAGLKKDPGSIRLAMGVGGSFDYVSRKIKRAPKWIRVVGFEWLYRLVQQPKRWKRIWNAVFVFLWKILLQK